MPQSAPKDLRYAENLRREGKLQEALEVINKIEKKETLAPIDKLALLISKGKVLTISQRYRETIRVGKLTYRLSQSLGKTNEMITSLLFKANSVYLGQADKALKYLLEAEKLYSSLSDVSPVYLNRQKKNILFMKSWAHFYKSNYNEALESALECLELQEKLGGKSEIAYTLQMVGDVYLGVRNYDLAIDYVSKSLTIFEELGDPNGKIGSIFILGNINRLKGNLNQAEKYFKQSLSSKILNSRLKVENLQLLGDIYETRGELDRAIKYYKRGLALAEKENFYDIFVRSQFALGTTYLLKGEYNLAIEYLKLSLSLAEKMNNDTMVSLSLVSIGMAYFQLDAFEEVQKYLDQLKESEIQNKRNSIKAPYQLLKGAFLIKKGGSINRGEAHTLLRQASTNAINPLIKGISLIFLCEFYLEELRIFEDAEVLKEISPLVLELYTLSEDQRMYGNLAEAKLLEAKLALIQLDFEEAQRLLTQAQRVAEMYGIKFTAQRISDEHDNYLKKLSEWKNLKEQKAPASERLKLASVDGVIERLQGTRRIEPPELVDEEPIVLLIMDKSGISYFNYPFRKDWDFDWLFSSFMSAFDTFSSEVFSDSIDRIIIGENLILINPVESFLVCYVIKGQSYPGLQKLNRFSKAIKENSEIWERLIKAVQTGEVLEVNNPQSLGTIVNEIFNH
jgi:tetratricopeptide (TPR) repeat protein